MVVFFLIVSVVAFANTARIVRNENKSNKVLIARQKRREYQRAYRQSRTG